VKGVGEPCAGEPHARFDGRGLETERYGVTAPAPDPTNLHFVALNLLLGNMVLPRRARSYPLTAANGTAEVSRGNAADAGSSSSWLSKVRK
jgi:hypothetical protein